jgi:hypothetical protein
MLFEENDMEGIWKKTQILKWAAVETVKVV